GSLLVVLFDIGLLVPCLQAVIFLGDAIDATTSAADLHFALEETADDMRLANDSAPIQQPSEQGVQTGGCGEDQVMAAFDLVQIPLIDEPFTARRRGQQRDTTIDPAIAKSGDGLRCERLTGATEDIGIVHCDEEVVSHLEADPALAELLGDEVVTVEADGD